MMTGQSLEQSIVTRFFDGAGQIEKRFVKRNSLRHFVVGGSLTRQIVEFLLADFPKFKRGNARNEAGNRRSKSCVQCVRKMSHAYRELDDLIKSASAENHSLALAPLSCQF